MSPDSLAASACSDQFGEKLTGRKVYRTGGKHRLLTANNAFSIVHLTRSRVGITVETFASMTIRRSFCAQGNWATSQILQDNSLRSWSRHRRPKERSEERRGGNRGGITCSFWWWASHKKKKN